MAITTKEGILKVLTAFNPWWRSAAVHPEFAKRYRRFIYYEAMKRLLQTDLRRTVILTGARRVGKTTVLYQMIQTLLSEGVPPRRILFTSLDHPMLKLAGLDDILSCYHENVYPDRDTYYFFDEIQYAADWALWLKTLYDTQPQSAVMGTGSASPILARRSSESGVGRDRHPCTHPLLFRVLLPAERGGASAPPLRQTDGVFPNDARAADADYDDAARPAPAGDRKSVV